MSKKKPKQKKKKQITKKTFARSKSPFWLKDKSNLFGVLIVLLITAVAFWPSLDNGFVNWDDDRNFYDNQLITDLNKDNFLEYTGKIFTTSVIGGYNPLSIFTFALEKMAVGVDNPQVLHRNNLILHLICVLLVFRLCLLLGLKWPGALIVSILFGIHPMRVESVAWITERKDVLFSTFYLAAMITYVKYKVDKSKRKLILLYLFFILSLFSKIQAVALPLSMIAIDYLQGEKLSMKMISRKWSYFLISFLFGVLGFYFLEDKGTLESNAVFPLYQRIFIGTYSFIVYLMKFVFPYEMSPLYPYPSKISSAFYASIVVIPITLGLLYHWYKKGYRVILFGAAFFIFNIMFLLQIVGAGQGFLADRFTYMAYLGLFFIIGYYADKYWITSDMAKKITIGALTLCTALFGFMTFQQCKIWKDGGTMWSHVLKYYQLSTLPYGNRANFYRDNGRSADALIDYNKVLSLKPDSPQALNSRARLFFNTKNNRDTLMLALNDYNKAIELEPQNGEFLINRGATFARLGNIQNAIEDLTAGLNYKPDQTSGYINRFLMHYQVNNFQAALEDIKSYLKYKPYASDAWYEKGRTERQVNLLSDALASFNRAIELNNTKGLYFYERSKVKYALGRTDEAKSDLQYCISLGYTQIDAAYKQLLGI